MAPRPCSAKQIQSGASQLPGNWDRQLGIERDAPGIVPGDVRDLGGCGSPVFGVELDGGKLWRGSLGSEPLARARQLFYELPKATCQATLNILAGCGSPLFWCRNRWRRLPGPKPSAATPARRRCWVYTIITCCLLK